jgi:hypothetical protein
MNFFTKIFISIITIDYSKTLKLLLLLTIGQKIAPIECFLEALLYDPSFFYFSSFIAYFYPDPSSLPT